MCQLLSMNCNTPTDIVFSFTGFSERGGRTDEHKDGWGIAFLKNKAYVTLLTIGLLWNPLWPRLLKPSLLNRKM